MDMDSIDIPDAARDIELFVSRMLACVRDYRSLVSHSIDLETLRNSACNESWKALVEMDSWLQNASPHSLRNSNNMNYSFATPHRKRTRTFGLTYLLLPHPELYPLVKKTSPPVFPDGDDNEEEDDKTSS
jgi:hypothetical protein